MVCTLYPIRRYRVLSFKSGKRPVCLWRLRLREGVFHVFGFVKSVFGVSFAMGGHFQLSTFILSKGIFLKRLVFNVFANLFF